MEDHIKEKVDILVPVYKEPMNVIERMLAACYIQNVDNIENGGNGGNSIDLNVWLCIDGADINSQDTLAWTECKNKLLQF